MLVERGVDAELRLVSMDARRLALASILTRLMGLLVGSSERTLRNVLIVFVVISRVR
jgi:hypothetical protein